jgi:hypothetical protein
VSEDRVKLNELAASDDPEDVEAASRLNADLAKGQEASPHIREAGVRAAERLDESDLAENDEEELGGRS